MMRCASLLFASAIVVGTALGAAAQQPAPAQAAQSSTPTQAAPPPQPEAVATSASTAIPLSHFMGFITRFLSNRF